MGFLGVEWKPLCTEAIVSAIAGSIATAMALRELVYDDVPELLYSRIGLVVLSVITGLAQVATHQVLCKTGHHKLAWVLIITAFVAPYVTPGTGKMN